MKSLYTTTVHVTGGRDGRAVSDDGKLDIGLALPQSIGGSGQGSNPEQLFAAGFAACFNSSLRFAAKGMGLDPGDVEVDATVSLTLSDAGAYGVKSTISARIPGVSGADRDRVVAEAKRICAYSNATRAAEVDYQIA